MEPIKKIIIIQVSIFPVSAEQSNLWMLQKSKKAEFVRTVENIPYKFPGELKLGIFSSSVQNIQKRWECNIWIKKEICNTRLWAVMVSGLDGLAASVCEAHRDEYGPIWPISIAPWQVHLCCLRVDNPAVRSVADDIYVQLQKKGIEVIYDDRDVRAGVMFSDADLLGVPIRIVVSPRSLAENLVELSTRDKKVNRKVLKEAIVSETSNLIELLWKELEANV